MASARWGGLAFSDEVRTLDADALKRLDALPAHSHGSCSESLPCADCRRGLQQSLSAKWAGAGAFGAGVFALIAYCQVGLIEVTYGDEGA